MSSYTGPIIMDQSMKLKVAKNVIKNVLDLTPAESIYLWYCFDVTYDYCTTSNIKLCSDNILIAYKRNPTILDRFCKYFGLTSLQWSYELEPLDPSSYHLSTEFKANHKMPEIPSGMAQQSEPSGKLRRLNMLRILTDLFSRLKLATDENAKYSETAEAFYSNAIHLVKEAANFHHEEHPQHLQALENLLKFWKEERFFDTEKLQAVRSNTTAQTQDQEAAEEGIDLSDPSNWVRFDVNPCGPNMPADYVPFTSLLRPYFMRKPATATSPAWPIEGFPVDVKNRPKTTRPPVPKTKALFDMADRIIDYANTLENYTEGGMENLEHNYPGYVPPTKPKGFRAQPVNKPPKPKPDHMPGPYGWTEHFSRHVRQGRVHDLITMSDFPEVSALERTHSRLLLTIKQVAEHLRDPPEGEKSAQDDDDPKPTDEQLYSGEATGEAPHLMGWLKLETPDLGL